MKALIILYFVVLAGMLIMVPVKFLSSRQLTCHVCHNKSLLSKKIKNHRCPHCGSPMIRDGNVI